MIYPTRRAIFLILAGAPLALLLGLYRPDLWIIALLWGGAMIIVTMLDAMIARQFGPLTSRLSFPRQIGVGESFTLTIYLSAPHSRWISEWLPENIALSLAVDTRFVTGGRCDKILSVRPALPRTRTANSNRKQAEQQTKDHTDIIGWNISYSLRLTPTQRGTAQLSALWLRWRGPLKLVWKQQKIRLTDAVLITPAIASVREEGIALFARDSQQGLRRKPRIGEGGEYESLTEFHPGMDRRAIDWNQTARHRKLLAKEYDLERNNRLILALDSGRMMSEPVAGMARIDHTISAALLLGYAGLRMHDQVSLFSFATQPGVMTPAYRHSRDFQALQRAAATIAYSYEESNFTLALVTLAKMLTRRSLIVLFTEFSDPVSAALMIRSARRLVKKHRLLFVLLKEADLEQVENKRPDIGSDIIRANVATALLNNRRIVIAQLRRMGAEVLEAHHNTIASGAVAAYMRMKHRGNL